ncbi:MAG TPA: alpha/beta hydrolase [Acidobacteriota bacterium]
MSLSILGTLLIVLAIITYHTYRQDIHAARARVSSGSQVVNTACGPIEYAAGGKGIPVLMIHGAGGGFDQGLETGWPLLDNGFQLIAVSRFGYLRTPFPTDASPAAQADAHICLLDALNLPKVVVIGLSAGAPSAMQLCLRHPERRRAMVLLVPIAFAPPPAGKSQQQPSAVTQFVMNTALRSDFVSWILTKLARETMVETILATPASDFRNATPDEQERVVRLLRHILPISRREKGLWNDAVVSASIPRYELERFTVPALVISAENDLFGTFRSARYTAEHVPGAHFVGFATGGHLLAGRQQEAWSALREFLNKAPDERQSIKAGST